ncbi:MAG: tetratricopeptide repeat protein [Gammaproteobacteria bacterium]
MKPDAKFWAIAALLQAGFGLTVFAITRNYYAPEPAKLGADAARILKSLPQWPEQAVTAGPVTPGPAAAVPPMSTDPAAMWNDAEDSFSSGNYARAAGLYEQLLALDPQNVELYNNLGLTLHYLGRSTEALEKLRAGAARDPAHQRTWLTTGFINAQLGNAGEARSALEKAQVGPDDDIRKSAREMLASLSPSATQP